MAGRGLAAFCSRRSIEARERIFGTASTAHLWLLLEYNGAWSRELLADSDVPAAVKRRIADLDPRLLFIKNDLRGKAGLSCYVALSRPDHRALYRFELDRYDELLGIDLAGLVAGTADFELQRVDDPLYLVCVDGKHDKCCAKFGLPVYREMVRAAGDAVWQASHVGGDRFAANVVCLPSGVYYGHIDPHEAGQIVRHTAAGAIFLAKFRGRSCYPFPTQAAEYFARVASGLQELDALTVDEVARHGGLVHVRLGEAGTGRTHVVELARVSGGLHYLTCTAAVAHDVPRYVLRRYHLEE